MFKLNAKSSLLKNAASYTFFNILNAATPFLLIPILTTHLQTDGYGIIAMFTILISVLNPIIGLSVNGAITRQYFSLSQIEFKRYIGNCFLIFLVSVIILALFFFFGSNLIFEWTAIPAPWLYVAILISSFQFIYTVLLTYWQVTECPLKFGLFQVSNSLLNLLISIYLVVGLSFNWQGRLYAWLISASIMAIVAVFLIFKNEILIVNINKGYIRHALNFSIPLIPHTIGGLVIGLSDRVIIKNVLGVGETGIYTVAFQLASVLGILMTAFNSAFVPWLFKRLREDSEEKKSDLVKYTYFAFLGIIALVILGSIVNYFLSDYIIGSNFSESKRYVPFLLMAFGFNGMYMLVTNYLFYIEKTHLLAKSTFAVALINIPLCYFLTLHGNLIGAAIATIVAYFLLFIFTWILSARSYKMPWFGIVGLKFK
jgi:O-antigen/teichoic acid export membrane protein